MSHQDEVAEMIKSELLLQLVRIFFFFFLFFSSFFSVQEELELKITTVGPDG